MRGINIYTDWHGPRPKLECFLFIHIACSITGSGVGKCDIFKSSGLELFSDNDFADGVHNVKTRFFQIFNAWTYCTDRDRQSSSCLEQLIR